ncbi:protein-disulfide reductase DsbD [Legionella hackeliae]|nr:protein-disulfide reductase DsbD [Legionella hackeliae]
MRKWLLFSFLCFVPFINHASPLPATEVFQVDAKQVDPNTLSINWQVKPGYFLYADRIKLTMQPNSNVHMGTLLFPAPLTKIDKQGHNYSVYRNELSLPVPVLGESPGETLINLSFQGCADDGFCYPPETRQIKLTIDNSLALTHVSMENISPQEENSLPASASDTDEIERVLTQQHWGVVILTFFGFGLLLSFTPCILPMVPVLSGIIVGHGNKISTRKAFFLSLSYVLSMSVTYAVVGAVVALLGSNLQIVMQSPWAIGTFSLVFVLLALSMFGYYELRLPLSWQAKLAGVRNHQASGHYLGAALMGCFSTLILSPCVTAPLIGALSYIAHSNNIAFGSLALFFLGLGMGTPLLLIGTSAGKWLPKAGQWMNGVKIFFGILLLAVAIFLVGRILPGAAVMLLWSGLLIFVGLYCGALSRPASNLGKFQQGVGLISLVYGLLILIGASMGNSNPLQPLAGMQATANAKPNFSVETVSTPSEIQHAIDIAKAQGKPVMLDFYADWCTSCQIMEATTFKDPQVEAALKNFIVLKVDITANNAQDKALLQHYGVVAPPTFLFFNKQGNEQSNLRLIGEASASKFLEQLTQASALD